MIALIDFRINFYNFLTYLLRKSRISYLVCTQTYKRQLKFKL